jgi:glycosyltransferase involved in cell wall biosynthesis
MKIRVLLVISSISKVVFFEWLAASLNKSLFQVSFVVMNDSPTEVEAILKAQGEVVYHISYKNKFNLGHAVLSIMRILEREKIDVIHTHLLDATLAGMIAGRIKGTKKRILTRHHSNYHHVYNRKGILYDKLCNKFATDIIAITDIVRTVLREEGASSNKIHLIHHGFRLEEYSQCSTERINSFRERYDLHADQIIVGVVSRYTKWKGVQFIIPAFEKFLKKYPGSVLLLANAKGNDEELIKGMLQNLPKENVREITYERDMAALYHTLTVFVHVPIDRESEAFGQTYVEAMAAGVPSVVTMSGIANDYIVNQEHAWVVPFQDSDAIYHAIDNIVSSPELAERFRERGRKIVEEKFSLEQMVAKLEDLYLINE